MTVCWNLFITWQNLLFVHCFCDLWHDVVIWYWCADINHRPPAYISASYWITLSLRDTGNIMAYNVNGHFTQTPSQIIIRYRVSKRHSVCCPGRQIMFGMFILGWSNFCGIFCLWAILYSILVLGCLAWFYYLCFAIHWQNNNWFQFDFLSGHQHI